MNVINRVETMGGPNMYKGTGRRIDLPRAAERQAKDLDSREPADSKLSIKIKVLLIGMTGMLPIPSNPRALSHSFLVILPCTLKKMQH